MKFYDRILPWNWNQTVEAVPSRHITVSPEVRFGKPCIAGTRIAVEDVAVVYLHKGESLEKVALDYNLSLASVYAAIAYYYDNQEEIDRRQAEGKVFAEEFKRNNPSLLQEKLTTISSLCNSIYERNSGASQF